MEFGRFKILLDRRELLVDGRPVQLSSRAFDIAHVLVEAQGRLVTKDEIMRRVWPSTVVEENSLQVAVSALRKALNGRGETIRTITGRGYQMLAAPSLSDNGRTNLPVATSRLIGRDDALKDVAGLLSLRRVVTLTGAGGIGKTKLSLEVARKLLPNFGGHICLVELASLSKPELTSSAVANAVGLVNTDRAITPAAVARGIGERRLLLVLDNCEHVIGSVAELVETIVRVCPNILVLATSREALRIEGEHIYRVRPLDVPSPEDNLPDDILRHGAVQLFIANIEKACSGLVHQKNHLAIATICRRLDGIPLAIELAAARAAALGVHEVASRLDDCFSLLAGGRRTALPRQQTLRATLDWSYELLPETERRLLRRISVFSAGFTSDAVNAVVGDLECTASSVVDGISNLVSKSLVNLDRSGSVSSWRLLETTRTYARERLIESNELEQTVRRHAEYVTVLSERAESEVEAKTTSDWLLDHGRLIDDVRSALDWAFSPHGDVKIGIALTVAAVPFWMHLSLVGECRDRVQKALTLLETSAQRDAYREMKLWWSLAITGWLSTGPGSDVQIACTKTLEVAASINNNDYQLRALWGAYTYLATVGNLRAALDATAQFQRLAANAESPIYVAAGYRLRGVLSYVQGDSDSAMQCLDRALLDLSASAEQSHRIRFQYDLRTLVHCHQFWVYWLKGFTNRAMAVAQRCISDAEKTEHLISQLYALYLAGCPAAFFSGDLVVAERQVKALLQRSDRSPMPIWGNWARCYEGVLLTRTGNVKAGLSTLEVALAEYPRMSFNPHRAFLVAELVAALRLVGRIGDALAEIDKAIARSKIHEEWWYLAEFLRIKGELLQDAQPNVARDAEALFMEALDLAHRQGALSWELRAATSLARLLGSQGHTEEAAGRLAAVYRRFSEGFSTDDMQTAKLLLDSLGYHLE